MLLQLSGILMFAYANIFRDTDDTDEWIYTDFKQGALMQLSLLIFSIFFICVLYFFD